MLRLGAGSEWQPRSALVAELLDADGAVVDQVVATWFAAPRSYTAEDVVEISCHGSPVVLRHCVDRALHAGARPANPGEFTLRAYVNGRIDLPQAEAVHDLIHATTLHQARVAALQLDGSVSRALAPSKAQLVELIALLEAGIDFAEDDVPFATNEELVGRLQPIAAALTHLAETFRFGKLVYDGITLALVGRPNVGKSSLFNALLQSDRAIVTEIPGTTRDTVSETFSLEGIPVRLVDTAGIRDSADLVERLGIDRSHQAMADADLTLVIVDLSQVFSPEDQALATKANEQGLHIVVGNKSDLPRLCSTTAAVLPTSAVTGAGVAELRRQILQLITPGGFTSPQSGLITSLRHESLLLESIEALQRAIDATTFGLPHEMILLDCYTALRALDVLSGATTADDILNHIFSKFCIGK